MSRLSHFAIFFLAAIHLLLFSICPVSSRIYRTKDAVVIEVDDLLGARSNLAVPNPSTRRSARSTFAGTAINPYSTGFYYHQKQPLQPNFISWWYPHLYKPISRHFLVQDDERQNNTSHRATYFPESKESKIAYGFDPSLQIQKTTPFVSSPDRIFGGITPTGRFPFMVGLKLKGGPVFCGGSIISPTKILTAAHCVDRLSVDDISTMSVSLGMTTQEPNDAVFTRRVVRAVYHLEHNRKTKQFDIAILTIDPPVSYSNSVYPVCLPPASTAVDQFAGYAAVILGWGRTNSSSPFKNKLQAAEVLIITNSLCSQPGMANQGFSINNQHICAGFPGISSCEYDDGGPMVLVPSSSGCYTQVGITSVYGTNCATKPDTPSVYTNVAFFRDWIDQYATPQYFIKIPTIQNLLGNNYQ